ncbi:MAG: hypothetical protein OEY56_07155 [Cyclobacteriaceae bacterium]|nr:hypothetical protein [Cyclobacteriaceae bacterium]
MRLNVFLCFFLGSHLLSAQSDDAMVRITANDINREYKVLFAAKSEFNVIITLYSEGAVILEEKFPDSKAFVKAFSLKDAPYGRYEWRVSYGDKSFTQQFEIVSEKKLIKESISANLDEFLNLTISVKSYNKIPLSIFLYKDNGEQLDFIFWEPENDQFTKTIKLNEYNAYEIKLEILQKGDLMFSESYKLF